MRLLSTISDDGFPKIEQNPGMRKLAQQAKKDLLSRDEEQLRSKQTMYELLAYCNDIHRKFDKSFKRGQCTKLAHEEQGLYFEIRADKELNHDKLIQYFSLFAPSIPKIPQKRKVQTEEYSRKIGRQIY